MFQGAKEIRLQKLFSTFPAEWPGIGLLLIRALLGLQLIVQGVGYIQSPDRGLVVWVSAALAFMSGTSLLAGLLTPFVAVVVAIGGMGLGLSWFPLPAQDLFNNNLVVIDQILLAIAIAFLGPGAFSLDARMFGRREITIPSNTHLSRP